ncbi:MAG TPA: TonB-dependent receptor, partial [Chitinophagales bacterium]|nr:TonB-dependent receptor [Chitinophagales bacterium]
MKKIFTCLLFLVAIGNTFAQTTISGVVTDNKNNTLPGANIFLKDTYDGTTSDLDGKYSFTTTETGKQIFTVSFVGYGNYEDTIELTSGALTINVELKELFNELNAVVITAGAFEASDEKKNTILKPLDIVTTAGADGDIYGALETLPGASKVGNDDGLYVRGGSDYETKTVIDGMTVNNPYYSTLPDIPSRGRFQPFMFKGTVFSTGGYSAEYGQALSSAVILNTEDMPEYSASGLSLAPIFVGGFHTQKFKNEKTALGGGINYTNLALFDEVYVPTTFESLKSVEAVEGSLFFRQKTSQTGIIKLYAQKESSDFAVRVNDIDSLPLTDDISLGNNYNYVNISYRELLTKNWGIQLGTSYSSNKDNIIADGLDIGRADQSAQGKVAFNNAITEKIKIRYGAEYQYQTYDQNAGDIAFNVKENYTAGFAESDIFITNDLAGRIGVRAENSEVLGEINIAPRVSLAYKTGKNSQVSFAYGDFYQTPQPTYLYTTAVSPLTYEKATHYIGNYQYVTNDRTFRVEGYYKDYDNLVTQESTDIPFVNNYFNDGKGYAKGIDVFFRDKKTIKYADYWISYSYLDTKRKFLDYPEEVTPTFAAQHIFSLVYKHYFPTINTQVSVTYR